MRIPPYYQKGSWQRFFAGCVCGGITSWIIFAYMFGVYQDTQIKYISQQADRIADLEEDIEIWKEDYQKLNEENKKGITLQEISVKLTNGEKYKFNSWDQFTLESEARKEINHLIAKDISVINESKELIKRAIENKVFTFGEKKYRLKVRGIFLVYTNLEVQVEIEFEKK